MKKIILTIVALSFISVCFAGSIQEKHKAVIGRQTVAGAGVVWNTSDFSTEATGLLDNDANWSAYYTGDGTPVWTVLAGDQLEIEIGGIEDRNDVSAAIHQTETLTVDQCMSFQIINGGSTAGSSNHGAFFRAPTAGTGDAYKLSIALDTDSSQDMKWEKYTDYAWVASIQTSGTDFGSVSDGHYIGFAIIGTGASTIAYGWNFGASLPSALAWDGNTGGGNWGVPTVIYTDNPGANSVDTGNKVGVFNYTATTTTLDTTIDNWGGGDIDD
jgi:hypothetical protein